MEQAACSFLSAIFILNLDTQAESVRGRGKAWNDLLELRTRLETELKLKQSVLSSTKEEVNRLQHFLVEKGNPSSLPETKIQMVFTRSAQHSSKIQQVRALQRKEALFRALSLKGTVLVDTANEFSNRLLAVLQDLHNIQYWLCFMVTVFTPVQRPIR